MKEEAEDAGMDLDKFKAELNDQQKEYIKENAATMKTVKLMLDSATVNDKPETKAEEPAETPAE